MLNMTFEELEDITMKPYKVRMHASKWRSGLGAVGYSDVKVEYRNGKWQIRDIGSSWIS